MKRYLPALQQDSTNVTTIGNHLKHALVEEMVTIDSKAEFSL